MPRKASTCRSTGAHEQDWCAPCRNPRLKAKCARGVAAEVAGAADQQDHLRAAEAKAEQVEGGDAGQSQSDDEAGERC